MEVIERTQAVNPKGDRSAGVPAFADVNCLIPIWLCWLFRPVMSRYSRDTGKARSRRGHWYVLSAGFGEGTLEGALLEERILETVNKYGASLIGPNWHRTDEYMAS